MLFNSFPFLVLLAVTLVLYYLPLPGKWARIWQVVLLLAASAVFYAWENPRLLILLSFSCLMNAVVVERIIFHQRTESPIAKRWLSGGVIANLALLAFFKYAGILPVGSTPPPCNGSNRSRFRSGSPSTPFMH